MGIAPIQVMMLRKYMVLLPMPWTIPVSTQGAYGMGGEGHSVISYVQVVYRSTATATSLQSAPARLAKYPTLTSKPLQSEGDALFSKTPQALPHSSSSRRQRSRSRRKPRERRPAAVRTWRLRRVSRPPTRISATHSMLADPLACRTALEE